MEYIGALERSLGAYAKELHGNSTRDVRSTCADTSKLADWTGYAQNRHSNRY